MTRAVREAVEALLRTSVEAYAAEHKPRDEWDEYDESVLPLWLTLRAALAEPDAGEPADDHANCMCRTVPGLTYEQVHGQEVACFHEFPADYRGNVVGPCAKCGEHLPAVPWTLTAVEPASAGAAGGGATCWAKENSDG